MRAELKRLREEEVEREAARIAEENRAKEKKRIAEDIKRKELERMQMDKRRKEEQRIEEERKLIEKERIEKLQKIEEMKRNAYEELIACEASSIAGIDEPVFYNNCKNIQMQQIQRFLRDNIPYSHIRTFLNDKMPCIDKDLSFSKISNLTEAKRDQLSKKITEVFPGVNLCSFLTFSKSSLAILKLDSLVVVSKDMHFVPEVTSVMHIQENAASTETIFDGLADVIEHAKSEGRNTLLSCEESTGLAATLAITYVIKYKGMSVKNAIKSICQRNPQIELDQKVLIKLTAWEKKLRRKQMCDQMRQMVVSYLPLLSVLGLLCLALKLFQDEIERQHRKRKQHQSTSISI